VRLSSISCIVAIGTGRLHTLAVPSGGAAWAWGDNDFGQLGFGDTMEDRYRHVELLDDMGLARQGAVDTGSVNLGGTGPDGLPPPIDFVYTNPFRTIRYQMEVCTRRGLARGRVFAPRSSGPRAPAARAS
jgi:hypothetical protein